MAVPLGEHIFAVTLNELVIASFHYKYLKLELVLLRRLVSACFYAPSL